MFFTKRNKPKSEPIFLKNEVRREAYQLGRAPPLRNGSAHTPLHPQLMLWFTYDKGTFSTFVFATQNRAFMFRSVLR